jgi:hypothetical protein
MILPDSEVALLKTTLGCWEWFGYISTTVVGVGCIGEFIAEFTSLPGTDQRKHKLARLSLMILILGIAGELLSAVRTSQLSGQIIANIEERAANAEQKAGEANDRATANEKEAAQLRKDAEKERTDRQEAETALSPRTLSLEQQRGIVQYLKMFSGHRQVSVGSYGMDGEGMALGGQIIRVIEVATGTAPSDARASIVVSGGFESGISIRGPDYERPFMDALGKALTTIGKLEQVSVNGLAPPVGAAIGGSAAMGGNAAIGGGGGAPHKVPIPSNGPVRIWVGIKPPPLLPVTSKQK